MKNNFGKLLKLGPFLWVCLFFFLFFRSYEPGRSVETFAVPALALLVGLTLFMFVFSSASSIRMPKKSLVLLGFLVSMFLVSMVSSTIGSNTYRIQGVINNYTQQIIFFVLLLLIVNYRPWLDARFVESFAYLLVAFAVLTAIVGWQALLTGQGLFGPLSFSLDVVHRSRLTGFHASSNYSGIALALGFIASIYLRAIKRNGNLIVYQLTIVFLAISLLATGSRGSIVVALVGLMVYFFCTASRLSQLAIFFKRKSFYVSFFIITAFVGFIVFLNVGHDIRQIIDSSWFRMSTRSDIGQLGEEARLAFLQQGLEVYLSGSLFEFLFGFGNGGYQLFFGRSPHNSYLLILFEWGLLSIIVLAVFIVTIFYFLRLTRFSSNEKATKAFLLALLFAALTRGLFQSGELAGFGINWMVVIVIGVIVASNRRNKPSNQHCAEPASSLSVAT